jgi:hypothetical protein
MGADPTPRRSDVWVVSVRIHGSPHVSYNMLFADYGEADHCVCALMRQYIPPKSPGTLTYHVRREAAGNGSTWDFPGIARIALYWRG